MKTGILIVADEDGNIIHEYKTIIEDGRVTVVCHENHYEYY